MGLDIRWPIGLMFTLIGALLTILGIVAPDMSKPPKNVGIDINVNLIWGIVLLVFGLLMLFFANRGRNKDKNQPPPSA